MDSEITTAIAEAIKPLSRKIAELDRKVTDMEKQIKMHEKAFSDLVRSLNPRNR
jgi:hypothetical protein